MKSSHEPKVVAIYNYHGKRIRRIKGEDGQFLFVDDDFKVVTIKDENHLQTIKILIDGSLKSPWPY